VTSQAVCPDVPSFETPPSVLDFLDEGIMFLSDGKTILGVNDALCSMVGHSKTELVGKNACMLAADSVSFPALASGQSAMWNDDLWSGELELRRRDDSLFPARISVRRIGEEGVSSPRFIGIIRDISLERKRDALVGEYLSRDALTHLPNRLAFFKALDDATEGKRRRPDERLAVLLVDFERFREINKTFGYHFGDSVLKLTARRFSEILPEGCMIARVEGSLFGILVPDLDTIDLVRRIASDLHQTLEEPFSVGVRTFRVSASIGVSLYPGDGECADDLFWAADLALRKAKEGNEAFFAFFDKGMKRREATRNLLIRGMERALQRNLFRVFYQPQVRSDARKTIIGVEALIRWPVGRDDFIPPNRFIPLAEETGMIHPVGEWVLSRACEDAASWNGKGIEIPVSVNVSAFQIRNQRFGEVVRQTLRKTGLSPDMLILELTENALISAGPDATPLLSGLKELGIRLYIDDFGTGYSSLSYLQELPLDGIKVDRSFIGQMKRGSRSFSLVRAVCSLARELDLDLIAEGVETEDQEFLLENAGCPCYQGFLFSRPLPFQSLYPQLVNGTLNAGGDTSGG
jgi:diguanylate cyclase (GGDEF)-like protein/PAS domain S-box-containing protein